MIVLIIYQKGTIHPVHPEDDSLLLEEEIVGYLSENGDILRSIGKRSLPRGQWQQIAYQLAAFCFRCKAYQAGFALLRVYSAATQGEINKLTAKE